MIVALMGLLFFAAIVALLVLLLVAIVAKVRKRRGPKRRYIAVAAAVAVGSLSVAIILPTPPAPAKAAVETQQTTPSGLPAYLTLRKGQHAYLDSNAEGDGTIGTLFANWETVEKWYSGNFAEPSDLRHIDLPTGTEVVVDSWRTIGTGEDAKRMILVHTLHTPVRSGYSYDVLLLPVPPAGSTVVVSGLGEPKPGQRDKGVPMFPTPNAAFKNYISVRTLSKAVVLDVDQHRDTDWPYHVRILDGPQKGRSGYFARYVVSVPSNGAGGGEYSAWCKCVTMYLNTGNDK